eukprot:1452106-Rhodomonas_salina.3
MSVPDSAPLVAPYPRSVPDIAQQARRQIAPSRQIAPCAMPVPDRIASAQEASDARTGDRVSNTPRSRGYP